MLKPAPNNALNISQQNVPESQLATNPQLATKEIHSFFE